MDEPSTPEAPAKSAKSAPATKNLSVVTPFAVLAHGVDGVPSLTNAPTAVPVALVPAVRDAAALADVEIKES